MIRFIPVGLEELIGKYYRLTIGTLQSLHYIHEDKRPAGKTIYTQERLSGNKVLEEFVGYG